MFISNDSLKYAIVLAYCVAVFFIVRIVWGRYWVHLPIVLFGIRCD